MHMLFSQRCDEAFFKTMDSITKNYSPVSPLGEEEKLMYMNYLSTRSVSVSMSYADQQTSKVREDKSAAASETGASENTEKSGSFSDILDIASRDISPINNIEAYVTESVSKVLEKIAAHASRSLGSQAESYSVSVTSISITIELEEGESLSDVKSRLDDMLSEDGYWGVEQTSQRMFDFAHALTGDDPEALLEAKDAVTKGFKQAEALFGGQLPQISYDTYDAAMAKFDDYIEKLNSPMEETTYA